LNKSGKTPEKDSEVESAFKAIKLRDFLS